jgi:hypothetical protein
MAAPPERYMLRVPKTVAELVEAGGPEGLARAAAREAAAKTRRFWLDVLEGIPEAERDFIVQMYIGGLRRRLGLHQPKDVIRAQTRERVRRFRARQNSPDRE